jgi:hypothetical protein
MEEGLYLDFSNFEELNLDINNIKNIEDRLISGEITKEEALFLLKH